MSRLAKVLDRYRRTYGGPGAGRASVDASLGFDDHGELGENRCAVRTGANRRAG